MNKIKGQAATKRDSHANISAEKIRNEVQRNKVTPTTALHAGVEFYRAWEAEHMLDGETPSTAGPTAAETLILGLFRIAKINTPVLEERGHGDPAL